MDRILSFSLPAVHSSWPVQRLTLSVRTGQEKRLSLMLDQWSRSTHDSAVCKNTTKMTADECLGFNLEDSFILE